MNHRQWRLVVVLFLVSLFCAVLMAGLGFDVTRVRAVAGDRYVDPAGSDTGNDCSNYLAPCQTIGRGVNQANSGDTVHVAAGVYNEAINITKNLIMIGAGEDATFIDGTGTLNQVVDIYDTVVVTITDLTIQNGEPTTQYGAGLHVFTGCTVTLESVTVYDNVGGDCGGGICVWESMLTLSNSTVISNRALGSEPGGGIHVYSGILVVDDSTIISNSIATGTLSNGGGIYVLDSVLDMENSLVAYNSAPGNSGGGGIMASGGGVMTLTNVTVSGNSADKDGGGINVSASSTATLRHCTVVSNTADLDADTYGDGGGIYAATGAAVSFERTILANNSAQSGNDCSEAITSLDHNLIEDIFGCIILGSTGANITGSDPLLAPLADNGGETWTHALQAGSAALNWIDTPCVATDQRGMYRPVDTKCDVGAYEAGPLLSFEKQVDNSSANAGQVVNFTILVHNSGLYSATNATISDKLPPSLTLAGPVVLNPASAGSAGSTPSLVTGLTVSPGLRVTVTFPVVINTAAPHGLIITNTAAIFADEMDFSWRDSATVSVPRAIYLPLVLRN